jgi:hypothetical protein
MNFKSISLTIAEPRHIPTVNKITTNGYLVAKAHIHQINTAPYGTIVEIERGFDKIPIADDHMLPSIPHNMDPDMGLGHKRYSVQQALVVVQVADHACYG